MTKKVVALLSGGLDSAVMAFELCARGRELILLSFNYEQRHSKELGCAARIASMPFIRNHSEHYVIDLRSVGILLKGSALTDPSVEVPQGHYADESMRSTVVPNRNAIFLSIAFGIAAAHGAESVAYAAHAGDHPIYPDCRPEFVVAFELMEMLAMAGYAAVRLETPFIYMTKDKIVKHGDRMFVPFGDTWSCYEGGELHCGRCGTCVERKEAFQLAGVMDPTKYESES